MIKHGLLNANAKFLLARMGHRDLLGVTDAGYNTPIGAEVVDLAVLPNIPTMEQVLNGIKEEVAIEKVYLACEIKEWAPDLLEVYNKIFEGIPISFLPHTPEFDNMMCNTKGIIRTGQYWKHEPNCILQIGCTYD